MDTKAVATNINRLLDTTEASAYLAERGISRTEATLRVLRHTGGGPAYHKVGTRDVRYTDKALDAWMEQIISPERVGGAGAA
jgi:hypothetical protein